MNRAEKWLMISWGKPVAMAWLFVFFFLVHFFVHENFHNSRNTKQLTEIIT